jgi:hypothetical protein
MAEMTQEIFSQLNLLNKREKLRIVRYLVEELALEEEKQPIQPKSSGWPEGYFAQTYGILRDDPIVRPEQGVFENREPLE